ncbi:hypothetical protein F0562_027039 [Nyssa sinensis]|uniref:HMA domain-containing protein n=1 Tax=Nyssa sinensis TaxID=561372 RepID=A0A5J5B3Z5_9ASTE|nr:hypothetical protein F0562_027039 [Nyssa sinensis]
MAEKVTIMVLKVDLQCARCYKKIKKILCEFPQIGDQVYDDKQNTVTITVQSCNPEKIRDKLCCKGGKIIKCIEIKKPSPTPPPEPLPIPVAVAVAVQIGVCCGACYEGRRGGPCCEGYGRLPPCSCGCGTGRSAPSPCNDGYYRRPCYSHCDFYFTEENPSGCAIM